MVIEWVGSLNREDVMQRCLDNQVPVGKVNSIADIFEDEHFQARGNLARVEAEGLGEVVVPGVLPTLSETPGRITNLGPPLGNATYEVMRDLLGISAEEIEECENKKSSRSARHASKFNLVARQRAPRCTAVPFNMSTGSDYYEGSDPCLKHVRERARHDA